VNWVSSLWETLWDIMGWFQICTFIDPWEEGVLVRRGKFKRVVTPGVAWHLPLAQDEITTLNIRPDAMELDEQVLTTKDGYKIVIKAVLMWSIHDIRKCLLDVEDAAETLEQISVGYVHDVVELTNFDDIMTKNFRRELKKSIQTQARKFGITVSNVKIQDFAETKVIRLIT
jgi:regulator of protease activity HflC (stomatin/prohibitin superfamily)